MRGSGSLSLGCRRPGPALSNGMDATLGRLALAYSRGELVPFIGSGMSVPTSPTWEHFVRGLASQAAMPPFSDKSSPSLLIRYADRAAQRLTHEGRLAEACRTVLGIRDDPPIPPQTQALAKARWPLVVSTNYDDLYVRAVGEAPDNATHTSDRERPRRSLAPVKVFGRGAEDCRELLRELDLHTRPALWAIQGYLGSRGAGATDRRELLEAQVVVGHHQYQRAIHDDRIFRRAFAEVFRRRSLLFLGSGLEEDYLVNLFGEVMHGFGPGNLPHFAFMKKSEAPDPNFLLTRLNVHLITFEDFPELPMELERLVGRFEEGHLKRRLTIQRKFHNPRGGTVTIRAGEAPTDGTGAEAVVASFGRTPNGKVHLGSVGGTISARLGGNVTHSLLPGSTRVYRFGETNAFGVVSTTGDEQRDLRGVMEGMKELLEVTPPTFRTIRMPLLAAGEFSSWPRVFSLIQMLRGVRAAARVPESVVIHVVDPRVLTALDAGQVPVEEILACDDVRFWIEVETDQRVTDRVLAIRPTNIRVDQVAEIVGIGTKGWMVRVLPTPNAEAAASEQWSDVGAVSVDDLGLCPGGTLQFRRRERIFVERGVSSYA